MTPTAAYIHGFLTRQQFIDAQMRIAERKLRLQRQIEEAQRADTAEQLVQHQLDTK